MLFQISRKEERFKKDLCVQEKDKEQGSSFLKKISRMKEKKKERGGEKNENFDRCA